MADYKNRCHTASNKKSLQIQSMTESNDIKKQRIGYDIYEGMPQVANGGILFL